MKKRKTIDSFFKQKEQTSASQDHSPSNIDVSNPSDQQLNKSPRIDVDGCNTSPHNNDVEYLDNLMNIPCHIDKVINAQSSEEKQNNRLRLTATIESIRWLNLQACAFRGHDESPSSNNRGNFIEMINFIRKMNKSIGDIVLEKAPKNAKYTSPAIQKDVLNIISNQVRAKIRKEIGDTKFCILVDEARDASNKEQMTIVLRFVDNEGFLRERFFTIVHVTNTTAATLKKEISDALGRYDLHIHNMRGQGYDGASNMHGSWNGLQALFLKDCSCAYYVHCFAHRLQLTLTAATEKEVSIWLFFSKLNSICNLINASPKQHGELHSAQRIEVAYMVATGERDTGRGCNQIGNLLRPGKTRWSSNFDSLCSMIDMYSSVITVLENMMNDGASKSIRGEASGALIEMKALDFIFILHLMHKIMGITNLLCRALQEKSLDILRAMDYVSTTKTLFRSLREEGFDLLLSHVKEVCVKYNIEIPHMEVRYKFGTGRSCQHNYSLTVEHHYRFDVFTAAIDFQIEELNNRFKDEAVELIKLSCALEPKEKFKLLNVDHIYRHAEKFYYLDFDSQDLHHLRMQLDHYKLDVAGHERFQNLSTIFELCRRLFETNKSGTYDLIDRLIRLILTLFVSTSTMERAFSAMKLVKKALRNKMEAEFFGDSMSLNPKCQWSIGKKIEVDKVEDDDTPPVDDASVGKYALEGESLNGEEVSNMNAIKEEKSQHEALIRIWFEKLHALSLNIVDFDFSQVSKLMGFSGNKDRTNFFEEGEYNANLTEHHVLTSGTYFKSIKYIQAIKEFKEALQGLVLCSQEASTCMVVRDDGFGVHGIQFEYSIVSSFNVIPVQNEQVEDGK
ncbi:uncharacterized protein [Primulina huaijiensis]|uniref:uncharacterized protein n=1 Tax=Primulina huaijiensis TaxID=1492673 RepID=UPI003CC6F2EA